MKRAGESINGDDRNRAKRLQQAPTGGRHLEDPNFDEDCCGDETSHRRVSPRNPSSPPLAKLVNSDEADEDSRGTALSFAAIDTFPSSAQFLTSGITNYDDNRRELCDIVHYSQSHQVTNEGTISVIDEDDVITNALEVVENCEDRKKELKFSTKFERIVEGEGDVVGKSEEKDWGMLAGVAYEESGENCGSQEAPPRLTPLASSIVIDSCAASPCYHHRLGRTSFLSPRMHAPVGEQPQPGLRVPPPSEVASARHHVVFASRRSDGSPVGIPRYDDIPQSQFPVYTVDELKSMAVMQNCVCADQIGQQSSTSRPNGSKEGGMRHAECASGVAASTAELGMYEDFGGGSTSTSGLAECMHSVVNGPSGPSGPSGLTGCTSTGNARGVPAQSVSVSEPSQHFEPSQPELPTLTSTPPMSLSTTQPESDFSCCTPSLLPRFITAANDKRLPCGHLQCSAINQLSRLTADIAAENPDMIHFQQVLNKWIRSQSGSRLVAFLLVSRECNACYCQVCGEELLKESVNCGEASVLYKLFPQNGLLKTNESFDEDVVLPPVYTPEAPAVCIDIKTLPGSFRAKLCAIAESLDTFDGKLPLDALCGSIVLLQERSGFVAGLLLLHQSERTREAERASILPHLHMIGTLLSIVANVEEQKRLVRQSQTFLSMAQNVFSSLQDMNLLVRNITKEAKTLVHAETCSLFLLDKEHAELVAEVFEKNGTSDEYLTEIRMPLSQGIVGQVATTGQMMNVKDVYNHPCFCPKVDERTGFVTRNILCFPIKDSSGNLVGVAELCNKIGKPSFTRHDEQIAATFAVYCAISISHCLLYRKLQEAHRRSHMAAELLVQGSTLSIAPEDILRYTVRDIPASTSFHPDFTQFHFVPRSIGTGDTYVEASLSMFKELGFIERFRVRRRTLARFLLMVQKGYRDVPYHNWSHAFAVGHFCYLLIRTMAVRNALTELERLSLFVACLCHDIDHRGTTNAFQLQSKTPLAQLYSSEGSVLERHHFAQTVSILSMEECNIFDQLTRQQYQTVLDNIREIILATDIAAHLRKVDRIKKMVEDGYDRTSTEHHYLLMCLLMTASDLSDQSKDFKNSKAIAQNIYREFFSQGDLEKQMGNRPLEMMDRDRACVPKIQLEFMDTVALPVFEYVSRLLPDVNGTYNALVLNRKCWQTLEQLMKDEGTESAGLDYLKNEDLENKVMQRIYTESNHDSSAR